MFIKINGLTQDSQDPTLFEVKGVELEPYDTEALRKAFRIKSSVSGDKLLEKAIGVVYKAEVMKLLSKRIEL